MTKNQMLASELLDGFFNGRFLLAKGNLLQMSPLQAASVVAHAMDTMTLFLKWLEEASQ